MAEDLINSFMTGPDEQGRFGIFGGRFVSETLMPLILDLQAEYEKAKTDPAFKAEMDELWTHYVGRPSPLYKAERLTERLQQDEVALQPALDDAVHKVLGDQPLVLLSSLQTTFEPDAASSYYDLIPRPRLAPDGTYL